MSYVKKEVGKGSRLHRSLRSEVDTLSMITAKCHTYARSNLMKFNTSNINGDTIVAAALSALAAEARRLQAADHPLVKAALAAFPGARIVEVRGGADAATAEPPLPDPDAYGEMDPDMIIPDDAPGDGPEEDR